MFHRKSNSTFSRPYYVSTDASSFVSGANTSDLSTLQRELHFAAEIGQYLLEQNQELERSLAECRVEGEWLRSILAQVDRATLNLAAGGGAFPGEDGEGRPSTSQRKVASGDDDTRSELEGLKENDLAAKYRALHGEYNALRRETAKKLLKAEEEIAGLTQEMESLNEEVVELRNQARADKAEGNRLRTAHAEEIERLKELLMQANKRATQGGGEVMTSGDDEKAFGDRHLAVLRENDELRLRLLKPGVRSVGIQTLLFDTCIDSKSLPRRVTFSLPQSPTSFNGVEGVTPSAGVLPANDSQDEESDDDAKGVAVDRPDAQPSPKVDGPIAPLQQKPGDVAMERSPSRSAAANPDISTIVRLMVGGYLHKYNKRRTKAERRFVMVNPYTRTISWSKRDPSDATNSNVNTGGPPSLLAV
ncbi:hypothetical protein HK101_008315 [Irineochytrium annulatum]|nr:hypothetical protein HK101_008315 [Irineochytrium annulatum]